MTVHRHLLLILVFTLSACADNEGTLQDKDLLPIEEETLATVDTTPPIMRLPLIHSTIEIPTTGWTSNL